jgi:hypothetical protein
MSSTICKFACFGFAILASTVAQASSDDAASSRLQARVPLVCEIDASDLLIDQSRQQITGTVFEACNGSGQFHVMASYRRLEDGERVHIDYGGAMTSLDPSGFSNVANRAGAKCGPVPVSINSAGLASPLVISFGLTSL